jgi:hypothetical protein
MGNGMNCRTTLIHGVLQGGANHFQSGAAPPPPPTGAVGGGVALHPSAVVVVQTGSGHCVSLMVPMPQKYLGGGYAFALCASVPRRAISLNRHLAIQILIQDDPAPRVMPPWRVFVTSTLNGVSCTKWGIFADKSSALGSHKFDRNFPVVSGTNCCRVTAYDFVSIHWVGKILPLQIVAHVRKQVSFAYRECSIFSFGKVSKEGISTKKENTTNSDRKTAKVSPKHRTDIFHALHSYFCGGFA